jgi:hypothetical protein
MRFKHHRQVRTLLILGRIWRAALIQLGILRDNHLSHRISMRAISRLPLFAFYSFLIFTVTACSFGGKETPSKQASAPPAASAAAPQTIPQNAAPATPTPMDIFRNMAPAEGMKFTPLFAEPLKDDNARIRRLEDSVQKLRNDLDTVVPSMVRMVSIEKDMKGLVTQLQTLTDTGGTPVSDQAVPPIVAEAIAATPINAAPLTTPPPLPVKKETEPRNLVKVQEPALTNPPEAAPKGQLPPAGAASLSSGTEESKLKTSSQEESKTKTSSGTEESKSKTKTSSSAPELGSVKSLRIGDHKDKTRLVFDMTAKTALGATLENKGKTLVIDMAKLKWLGKQSWVADSGALVSAYHIDGQKLYIDLIYPSQIKLQQVLPPSKESSGYRAVIDLFSADAHKK